MFAICTSCQLFIFAHFYLSFYELESFIFFSDKILSPKLETYFVKLIPRLYFGSGYFLSFGGVKTSSFFLIWVPNPKFYFLNSCSSFIFTSNDGYFSISCRILRDLCIVFSMGQNGFRFGLSVRLNLFTGPRFSSFTLCFFITFLIGLFI